MSEAKSYKSGALAAIHETAADMLAAGVIDKQTMRWFDESCLTSVEELTPEEIRAVLDQDSPPDPSRLNLTQQDTD